jgi:hypothetical protein
LFTNTSSAINISNKIAVSCSYYVGRGRVSSKAYSPIKVRNSSKTTAGPTRGNMTANIAAKTTARVPQPIVIIGLYGPG